MPGQRTKVEHGADGPCTVTVGRMGAVATESRHTLDKTCAFNWLKSLHGTTRWGRTQADGSGTKPRGAWRTGNGRARDEGGAMASRGMEEGADGRGGGLMGEDGANGFYGVNGWDWVIGWFPGGLVQNWRVAGFVAVRGVSKKAHRTHVEGTQKGGLWRT
jgi:hypothetical protein